MGSGTGVTAIIPNWNGAALLRGLLGSMASQTVKFERVIVVDNGSPDDSAAVAREYGAEVLQLERNLGFAVAVNRGVGAATSDWVAVLNNDLELEPDWLENILSGAGENWFAVGRVLGASQRDVIDGTWDLVARSGCAWRAGAGRKNEAIWGSNRAIRIPPLTAALLRRELFNRVGVLEERFESYLEDVEFGLRCASNGYNGIYIANAGSYHRGSATWGAWSSRTVRQISRNQVLLLAKHYSPALLRKNGWAIAVGQLLWGAVALRHLRGWDWLAGKAEGLRMWSRFRGCTLPEVASVVQDCEKELFALQRETGFDWYWKLYFGLT